MDVHGKREILEDKKDSHLTGTGCVSVGSNKGRKSMPPERRKAKKKLVNKEGSASTSWSVCAITFSKAKQRG